MITTEIIIEKLNENKPAQWLLFEIQNLHRTFPEPDDIVIEAPFPHTLYDTIENLGGVLYNMLDLETSPTDGGDEFDIMYSINISSLTNSIFK